MNILRGIKILDFSSNVAGPYATLTLARFGATVIKVERPEGDPSRGWAPFVAGESITFDALNRGKRSIAIDLKAASGKAVVHALLKQCDVMVHNFGPGVAAKLDLDEVSVRSVNPDALYCCVGAFGSGPAGARIPGYDPVAQAFSGILQMTGYDDGPGARCAPSMIDMATGQWTVIGILLSLLQRQGPGAGGSDAVRSIDANLIDSAMGMIPYQAVHALLTGERPSRWGTGNPLGAPHQVFATADSPIFVGAPGQAKWNSLLAAIGDTQLQEDVRFSTPELRIQNRRDLESELTRRFREHSAAYWQDRLLSAGIAVAPVLHLDETVKHPLAIEREWFEHTHPPIVRMPLIVNGEVTATRGRAPALGEHTREILLEFGFVSKDVDEMIQAKTVGA